MQGGASEEGVVFEKRVPALVKFLVDFGAKSRGEFGTIAGTLHTVEFDAFADQFVGLWIPDVIRYIRALCIVILRWAEVDENHSHNCSFFYEILQKNCHESGTLLSRFESADSIEIQYFQYHSVVFGKRKWGKQRVANLMKSFIYLRSDFIRMENHSYPADTGSHFPYGALPYNPALSLWLSVDPLSGKYPGVSPYVYCADNPIMIKDKDGREYDWVEKSDGTIYWDDNATSQETAKTGEKYLGKNVLVATHNRDADLNEPINSATFDLYLESNKEGPSASIEGNTVPSNGEVSGTLAEGLYPARFQGRAKYIQKGKTDLALIVNEGNSVPTAEGSSKSSMTGIFLHAGNNYQTSLFDSKGHAYSEGCLIGPCRPNSSTEWNAFGQQLLGFNGYLYLRGQPSPAPPEFPPIDSFLPGRSVLKRW